MDYQQILQTVNYLKECKRSGVAIDVLKVYCQHTGDMEAHNQLAWDLFTEKRLDEAILCLNIMYEAVKEPSILMNLSYIYLKYNKPKEVIECCDKCIEIDYEKERALLYKSVAWSMLGEQKLSKELFDQVNYDELDHSGKATYDYNKGWHLLRENKFQEGFYYYIKDGKHDGLKTELYPHPHFKEFEPGKTVLLMGEQGAGDEIIGARFGKIAKEHGMNTIFCTHHKLKSVLERTPGLDKVITHDELSTEFYDCYVPAMRAGWYFGLDETNLWYGSYISASKEYIEKNKLDSKGLKIGIRWQGNPYFDDDWLRRIPFKELEKLADLDNVTVYSLQRDYGVEEVRESNKVINLEDKLQTWEDTISIIDQLDVIVTSCTSIAHVAAAMGKKTIIITTPSYYLTWCCKEEGKSFWYGDNLTVIGKNNWSIKDITEVLQLP
jgi:tetratricopeptide (TPR) repeat protein